METRKAKYFGLEVEVLYQMTHCSLVKYAGKEFVVDTADLYFNGAAKAA